MKVLIDHGCGDNIGDCAMLSNVLDYLLQHTSWEFCLVDTKTFLATESNLNRVEIVNSISSLLSLPHWRISYFKDKSKYCRHLFSFIYWSNAILAALMIAFGVIFYRRFGKPIIFHKNLKYWIKLLSETDAYWVVGGGNINDIWIEQAYWKTIFAWIFKMQAKPVIFSGQGIGPIKKIFTKLLVKFAAKQITLFSLREKISFDSLAKLNIKLNNCYLVGDDALTSPIYVNFNSVDLTEKIIAFNLRISNYSFKDDTLLCKYVNLVELFLQAYPDYRFLFVPIARSRGDSDIISANEVINRLNKYGSRVLIINEELSHKNIKDFFKNISFSVGVSYHFCLFSMSMNVPTVALYAGEYYEQKLKGLMEQFNRKNGVFDLRNSNIKDLFISIQESLKSFDKSKVAEAKIRMDNDWYSFMNMAVDRAEEWQKLER